MDDYQAYQHTTFEADSPVGHIEVRIGEASRKIDRLLEFQDAERWSFLTAWNPGGAFAGEEQNRKRQHELERDLEERGLTFFSGECVPDNADWAPEECALVVGIAAEEARELAVKYGQSSVVVGRRRQRATLLDTETGEDVTHYSEAVEDEQVQSELEEMLDDLGGTVEQSVDEFRSEERSLQDAVDWQIVLRSLDDDYEDPDLDD